MTPYIGTSYYQAIKSPLPDVKKFIREIASVGGNATEFFILFTWQYKYFGASMPYIQRGFFEDNKYPGVKFPMWDLDQFDEKIWDKWREIFRYCKEQGVTPFIRIEDYCSLKTAYNKRLYWNYASYQRHVLRKLRYISACCEAKVEKKENRWVCSNCDLPCNVIRPNKKWWIEKTWRLRAELLEKVVRTLFEAGLKRREFSLVAMSEANMLGLIFKRRWCINYHLFFAKELGKLRVAPRRHMIISTMHGANKLRKMGFVIETHGINSLQMLKQKYFPGNLYAPNGDGQDKFAKGRMGTSPKKREPSVAQGREMGRFIKEYNIFRYCYFNRNTENPLPADINRAKFDVLKAIAEEAK